MDNILLKVENLNIEFHDHDAPERVVNHLDIELEQGGHPWDCRRIRIGKVHDGDGGRRAFAPS